MSHKVKEEAYGLGAKLSKSIAAAATYVSQKSDSAAEHLRRKQAEALAEAAADQAPDVAADAQADADDIGAMISGLLKKARAEAPELAKEAKDEVRSVLTRLEAAIDRRRDQRAKGDATDTDPADLDPTIKHF